jgi:hypothetical protein
MQEQAILWSTVLWQGFSLALVICVLARGAVAKEQGRELRIIQLSLPSRLLLGVFCVVGLFAVAATAGTPAGLTTPAIVATFAGVGGGIWLALRGIKKAA